MHLIFNSPYEFYELPEEERIKLIGRIYKARNWRVKKGKKELTYTDVQPTIYIPIGLHPEEFNYGIQQGVLCIPEVREIPGNESHDKWFKVGAFSPDDLDRDLEFTLEDIKNTDSLGINHLRQEIIEFIKGPMHKVNRRYKEVLEQIQKHFNAGKLY